MHELVITNGTRDGTMPTTQITQWVGDRTRGDKLPLPFLVKSRTVDNAALYGFDDRGSTEVGKRADTGERPGRLVRG